MRTFIGLKGREPLRTKKRIYIVYFFTSVFLLPLLSLQELAFQRGIYCHGTGLMRCCGLANILL
jgi:hypothetical protein